MLRTAHITDPRSLGSSAGGRAPRPWTRASATSSSKVDIHLVMPHNVCSTYERVIERLRSIQRS